MDFSGGCGSFWFLFRATLSLYHTESGILKGSNTTKAKTLTAFEEPIQRAAIRLFSAIDPRIARNASLSRALAKLDQNQSPKKEGNEEAILAAKLKALEEAEEKEESPTSVTSDDDYEAQLKELQQLAAEKAAREKKEQRAQAKHKKEVKRYWLKVKKITAKSAKNGIKAIELFLETYRGHRYGNPFEDKAK